MSETETRDALTPRERETLYAPDRRMDAYYYSFDPTGEPAIDAILSAVAHAGKGYHNTEGWSDAGDEDFPGRWGAGRSCIDVIQAAANEAAESLAAARAEVAALRSAVERLERLAQVGARDAHARLQHEAERAWLDVLAVTERIPASVGSSGEAESGGVWGTCDSCSGLADLRWSVEHTANFCPSCYARENPAPVPSGGQADGEGEGRPDRDMLSKAVIDVCWKATQYGTTEDGDTLAYILPKGAIHRLVGAAQSAGIPAALRASGVPAPEDGPATTRPVLSREALRKRLDGHWPELAGDVGDGSLRIECQCGWTHHHVPNGRGRVATWRDHLADVLAGGEQA